MTMNQVQQNSENQVAPELFGNTLDLEPSVLATNSVIAAVPVDLEEITFKKSK